MYENRRGYAQVSWFQNLIARVLSTDGRDKPHVRYVLETLRQLAGITVAGTDIPATLMAQGLGWSRLLALGRQRVESTGGAKDGGQHLDAGPSEKRKQNAAAFATQLLQIPSVKPEEVQRFVRITATTGSENDSEWISPSNHGG